MTTPSTAGQPAPAPAHDRVDRTTELDAEVDEVWEVLTDPDALGRWLGTEVDLTLVPGEAGRVVDPDGTVREVLVTDVDEHRRVAWHWWEDGGPLTSVEITLTPIPSGTRVDVHEILAASPARPRLSAAAPTSCTGVDERWLAGTPGRWSRRLVALAAVRLAAAA